MSKRMTWFLIDDDSDDQEIFLLTLGRMGKTIDCLVANDGIEALEKLKTEGLAPDIIILDLNMPFMDGKKCLIEIKKIERLKDVPVYIYSTSSESKLKAELKQLGATDYIEKPYSIDLLSEILTDLYQKNVKVKEE
jgi:CheY-like chemotaxis protein